MPESGTQCLLKWLIWLLKTYSRQFWRQTNWKFLKSKHTFAQNNSPTPKKWNQENRAKDKYFSLLFIGWQSRRFLNFFQSYIYHTRTIIFEFNQIHWKLTESRNVEEHNILFLISYAKIILCFFLFLEMLKQHKKSPFCLQDLLFRHSLLTSIGVSRRISSNKTRNSDN